MVFVADLWHFLGDYLRAIISANSPTEIGGQ